MESPERTEEYKRNKNLEDLLEEINTALGSAEQISIKKCNLPRYPFVFIVGAPRSGTTLLLQWLAATGAFAYPTNLMSRFYQAPYLGARIQQLLTDSKYAFRQEFIDVPKSFDFQSSLGKTSGLLAPNEFWYFWRRFLPNKDLVPLSTDEQEKIDAKGLLSELSAIETAFEKPFCAKGLIFQFYLDYIAKIIPSSIFIFIQRDAVCNAQSLLNARRSFYGTTEKWYSTKPPQFEKLKNLGPEEQVCGQVFFTNKTIEKRLNTIDKSQKLHLKYEQFCMNPAQTYDIISNLLAKHEYDRLPQYCLTKTFSPTNKHRTKDIEYQKLHNIYKSLKQEWEKDSGV